MTNQFMSFLHFLIASIYGLLSNPVAMRRVAFVVVVALIVVALIVPSVTTLAGGLSGGDPH